MDIGNKIYELRKNVGLSQEELGYKLNVSRQTVSKWETGQSLPELDKINGLCELFNLTADELIRNVPTQEKEEQIIPKSKISYLPFSIITFVLAIAVIPLLTDLGFSNNIMAFVVLILLTISVFFLVYYLKNRNK